jgi:hypothetical protein
LLQGLLNSIDGCLIRGENHGMCQGLFRTYNNMRSAKAYVGKEPTHPWFGAAHLNEDILIEHSREFLRRVLLGDQVGNPDIRCYGFKETRYVKMEPDYLYDYIGFLAQLFPDPAIVFNTRKLNHVANSAWWKDMDDDYVLPMLQRAEEVFQRYAAQNTNCYQIRYEDLIAKNDKLRGLFDFLGAPFDLEKIEQVLATPHSYEPTQAHVEAMFREKSSRPGKP